MQLILNVVYPVAALGYLISAMWLPYGWHPLVKAVPILVLAGAVLSRARWSRVHLVFGAGLLFSAAGDVVLASRIPQYFVIGLALFLVAHVLYSVSFLRRPRVSLRERWLPLSLVLGVVLAMSILVVPRVGPLLLPVMSYILAITAMGVLAAVQKDDAFLLYTGAFLFIVSDSIIAVNKFVTPIAGAGIWIMTTYYLAQALLTRGVLGPTRHPVATASQPPGRDHALAAGR